MKNILFMILVTCPSLLFSQINMPGDFRGDETVFYAQTKQVNQFFRRFNGEEDVKGKRYYNKDVEYHDAKARKKFLSILFDIERSDITQDVKSQFITDVINKKNPIFLDFHSSDWFAEVSASFTYKKEKVNIILYLKLVKDKLGYKWVFSNVFCNLFDQWFTHAGDTTSNTLFLHPLSHEIDFMNMDRVFRDPGKIDYYLEGHYTPDQLALFTMEVKNGNMKYEGINNVKFHFFQIPGWYFEISYYNRNDVNSGWLIDNILKITEKDKKELMRHYTHDE
ncbi:MAG: hypothetical protein NTX61_18945 [Bacteroidetes bacterium]|nr:hypothetical protein [Bacteroidota bacterium]